MDNKLYTKITLKLNKLQVNKEKVIGSFKTKLSEAEEQFRTASLHNTSNSGADEYVSAMEKKSHAQHYIDYYTECIKNAEAEPIFDDAEFNGFVQDIRSEQKKITDSSFNKIVSLLKEAFTVCDDMHDQITEFNHLIETLRKACKKPVEVVNYNDLKYVFLNNFMGSTKRSAVVNSEYGHFFKDHE